MLACVLASLLVPALALASTVPYAETRVGGLDLGNPYSTRATRALTPGTHQGYALAYADLASGFLLAARGVIPRLGGKLDFFLGRATGNAHNVARSTQMLSQLERIGLPDNPATRQYLADHLTGVLNDSSNIARIDAVGRVVRESLLLGPGGALKFETIWDGTRLLTGNLFGGPG